MTEFSTSDWIATGSGIVSLIALYVAVYSIRRSNRNSSVSTLVTLNDGFRQAWQRYLEAPSSKKNYEFNELANLLEIACGIHWEKSLFGISRELSREYIEHVVLVMEGNEDARRQLENAVHSPNTFKYISRFRTNMRKRNPELGKIR